MLCPASPHLLHIFVRITGAKRVLEIGTLGGYSGVCMARALPEDGRLVTLEFDKRHAQVARQSFAQAQVSDRIELILGDAEASMQELIDAQAAPFDFVFIDADKSRNPYYLDLVLQLSRSGTVIVLDNTTRGGAVADANSDDIYVQGVRAYFEQLKARGILSSAVQTVGAKGYDGFAVSVVS